jgi:hypothetical protein
LFGSGQHTGKAGHAETGAHRSQHVASGHSSPQFR